MKDLKNTLILNSIITLFSSTIPAFTNAQQFDQIRTYLIPTTQQTSYFPVEQQIQQASLSQSTLASSSFPPSEEQTQVFINQFSTPDIPRTTQTSQFVTPLQGFDNIKSTYQQYDTNKIFEQPIMQFPNTSYLSGELGNWFNSENLSNPFSFPNTFSAIPFFDNKGFNPIMNWNAFPLIPQITNPNETQNKIIEKPNSEYFPYLSDFVQK